jgi:CRP-like cAMP-binding protein
MAPLAGLGDHALLAAASGGQLRRCPAGSTVYGADDTASEIYLVVGGRVQLVRETPVGPQEMGVASPGDFIGEEALVKLPRAAEARTPEPATLLGLSADFLLESPDRAPWLRHLRACLARRLAHLNDFFQAFFPKEDSSHETPSQSLAQTVALSPEEKSRSLVSGGLSESDRYFFAAFAEERRYPAESVIFREGDAGDALYVIAQGRVRISRRIAGGEEALAILGPGEIFGEMAILDPESTGRSADARAHEEVLLLALTRARFEGMEKADPDGCADLSALLCRLAARRCVETAERLARWRIMAGPS